VKTIGLRYRLSHNVIAEYYTDGRIVLKQETNVDVFNARGKHTESTDSQQGPYAVLDEPANLKQYILQHGRPYGVIWEM
jgi:hypothetical protein